MSNAIGLIKNVFSLCNSNHFFLFLERWHTKHRKAKNQNKESRFEFFLFYNCDEGIENLSVLLRSPEWKWYILEGKSCSRRWLSPMCPGEIIEARKTIIFENGTSKERGCSKAASVRRQPSMMAAATGEKANFPDSTTLFPPFDFSRDSSTKIFGKLKFRTQKASRMHKKARSANWKAPCECFMSTRSKWASTNAQAKADDTDTITDLPSRSAHRSLTHSEN